MRFTAEQMALLRKYEKKGVNVGGIVQQACFLLLISATIFGLWYVTYLEPHPPAWAVNVLSFYVVVQIVSLWCYVPVALFGWGAVYMVRMESRIPPPGAWSPLDTFVNRRAFRAFVAAQKGGMNIHKFPWAMWLAGIMHTTEVVALAACGWTGSALLYAAAFFTIRIAARNVRYTAADYFASLTPSAIEALEQDAQPAPPKSSQDCDFHDILKKMSDNNNN